MTLWWSGCSKESPERCEESRRPLASPRLRILCTMTGLLLLASARALSAGENSRLRPWMATSCPATGIENSTMHDPLQKKIHHSRQGCTPLADHPRDLSLPRIISKPPPTNTPLPNHRLDLPQRAHPPPEEAAVAPKLNQPHPQFEPYLSKTSFPFPPTF
jgi:hypothetical protein